MVVPPVTASSWAGSIDGSSFIFVRHGGTRGDAPPVDSTLRATGDGEWIRGVARDPCGVGPRFVNRGYHSCPRGYLKRIGYTGTYVPTLDTLSAIAALHPRAIPFENLDVLFGRPPRLDHASLRAKLVASRRGGYCYEHASLCAAELEALGFTVARHSARVVMATPRDQAPRTHMFLTVLDHVIDPGFGGQAPQAPVPLDGARTLGGHRIVRNADGIELWYRDQILWISSLEHDIPVDFEMANHYTATYPSSWFVQRLMLARFTAEGATRLLNRDLTIDAARKPRSEQSKTAPTYSACWRKNSRSSAMSRSYASRRSPNGRDAPRIGLTQRREAGPEVFCARSVQNQPRFASAFALLAGESGSAYGFESLPPVGSSSRRYSERRSMPRMRAACVLLPPTASQHLADVAALHLVERDQLARRSSVAITIVRALVLADLRRQIVDGDLVEPAQRDRALDAVLELAHVARPVVGDAAARARRAEMPGDRLARARRDAARGSAARAAGCRRRARAAAARAIATTLMR